MTKRQHEAVEMMKAEGRPVHSRRLAGELRWRSQDAGRVLAALERDGVIKFVYGGSTEGSTGYVLV